MSRARARVGASGAGSSDPTVINLLADIEAEGEYRALTAMWEGEEEASGDEMAAGARRREGRAAATSTMLSGAASFAEKYA